MPLYNFNCKIHGEFEELTSYSDTYTECPTCKAKSDKVFKIEVSLKCPAYMKAPGSKGSSHNAITKQAIYLKSDEHKLSMEKGAKSDERTRLAQSRMKGKKAKLLEMVNKVIEEKKNGQ
jgi:putative FmdB family regulatory protein